MRGSRRFLVLAALSVTMALPGCGGGDDADDASPTVTGLPARDTALKAAAVEHLARSGVLAPGTGGVVLLADGRCATGSIWLESEADAAGSTLAEIAGSEDAGVVDESGTLLVKVGSTGGDASPADCRAALERALAGFDATRVD